MLGAEDMAMSKIIEAPVVMGLSGMSRTQTMQVNRWLKESERVCTQRDKRNKKLGGRRGWGKNCFRQSSQGRPRGGGGISAEAGVKRASKSWVSAGKRALGK